MEVSIKLIRILQWVKSDFNNWQVFKTPPGFSKTNNPLEQYNCRIKVDFTKRIKHHLKSSLKLFRELISYESDHLKEITIYIFFLFIKQNQIIKEIHNTYLNLNIKENIYC